jgi:hypothetical protein
MDAALIPAGPPPTTTTLAIGAGFLMISPDDHVTGCESRTGSDAFAVSEQDPAILASSHEAESRARRTAEFKMTDGPSGQQKHSKQAVAFDSLDGTSIDRQAQGNAVTGDGPHELPSRRPLS